MRHLMLFAGMGTALIAANACRPVPPTPLTAAAAANDVATVRRLLADGRPPDGPRAGAWTPLMWAAREGAIDAMAVLVAAGADVEARGDNGNWTPLLHAVHKQQTTAVRFLLEHGADPSAIANDGRITPLLMAAAQRDPSRLELLLRAGADAKYESSSGETALTIAVSGGALTDLTDPPVIGGCRLASVKALLAHDPSLRLPDTPVGRRAVWWARVHGCEAVLAAIGQTPTVRGQTVVGFGGLVRDRVRETLKGGAPATPATDAPSRR